MNLHLLQKRLVSSQQKINLLTDLVFYLTFEGNGIDDVSSIAPIGDLGVTYNNIGIIGNSASSSQVGAANNTVLRYGDSNIFYFSNGTNDLPFSISCWVNFSNISARTGNWIVAKTPVGVSNQGEFEFYFNIATQRFQFQKYSDNTIGRFRRVESFANLIYINTWYHVVVTSVGNDSSGMNIYVNGVNQSDIRTNSTNYTTISDTTSPLSVLNAGSFPQATLRLNGFLDEFAIWKNRELTPEEVLYLYNSGLARTYPL
jgi:hypothetical protein